MTTILIVDDDLDMRMLVRFAIQLANDGFEDVREAMDGDARDRLPEIVRELAA